METDYRSQLSSCQAQKRHWAVILNEHEKHLATATLAVRTAQINLDGVKLQYEQAPRKLQEIAKRIKTVEFAMGKNLIDPRIKKIMNLRAKLDALEAEGE